MTKYEIGTYLEHTIACVLNSYTDDRFSCQNEIFYFPEDDAFKCVIELKEDGFKVADVTVYLRNQKDNERMLTMLDLFIPNICSRLYGQLALRAMNDPRFREYTGLEEIANKLKTI